MDKLAELKRAKRLALSLLLIAAATFVTTLFLPPSIWVNGVKAIAEAAMVGALADWFAVVALFRRVPLPFISRHTAIIPRNKDRIGENLGVFVQEKFLDTQSLIDLIRRHEPALIIGNWFSKPENATRIGQNLLQVMSGFLDLTDDSRIQLLLKRAVHKAIDKVDLSGTSALVLESLTKNNRHQALLDALIAQLVTLLGRESTRTFIAAQVVRWLKTEHPNKARLLPTEWLGEHSAELVTSAVNSLLADISADQAHQIRLAFDRATVRLIERLKTDPEMAAKAESTKKYLKEDEAFNRYLGELWGDLRGWLKADMQSEDSRVKQRITEAGLWFGETLVADSALRASLNQHLEQAARSVAPEFARFLTGHISDTVKSWDAKDMSQQIELNIGKDLQFIRVNGTLVGGTIGLILFLLSQLPALFSRLSFSL
ncbi:DUF445 domain-containing protein [Enterobacter kobei]|uniref:Uncharacterized protein n=2 Tax=Enterobacter kobei TaxID=208224 RepID=A0ACC8S7W8_9ENTR|nr:DUF445 domain-containing protein [Enterobacter kobei]OLR19622.1 hypothetical protein BH713_02715 [Enterobacter kobei]BCU57154.1 membrane protein [Enterobacter kobei]SIR22761.1 Uncharacterized membrane-anchored protein YjiN, DUF445 family [Enterobacter kobei]